MWGPAALALKALGVKVLLLPANEVWGKVIFSQACVKNSVHRGVGLVPRICSGGVPGPRGGAWSGGVPGPGGCLVETPPTATATGGTHPTGMHFC